MSLRKIAKMAEVSATAPYSHFRDKQAVLAELATEGFEELADTMEHSASLQSSSSPDRLTSLAQGYVTFAMQNPALFQLMFGPAVSGLLLSPSLVSAGTRAYKLMESAVAERMTNSDDQSKVPVAAAGAWSMVHGVSTLLIDGRLKAGGRGLPQQQELVVELCRLLEFD